MDFQKLHMRAVESRLLFGLDSTSPIDIFSVVLSRDKLTLVFDVFSTEISGMCLKDNENEIIKINSSLTDGRQRYTVAHELYHLLYQPNYQITICKHPTDIKRVEEKEADAFASYFLMPWDALSKFLKYVVKKEKGPYHINDLISIEQYFKISHNALIWRMQNSGLITEPEAGEFRAERISSIARQLGYDASLYKATNSRTTLGFYVKRVNDLLQSQKVSRNVGESFLLDAFREDLVYKEITYGEQD